MAKKVSLLIGGWSAEREVSLTKGKAVESALREAGYDLDVIDVTRDLGALIARLKQFSPDVVFNNLHGRGGEDGEIQSVLEILEIPYTHSRVLASSIGMNKPVAKRLAATVGVPSPEGGVYPKELVLAGKAMDPPYVVKPPCEGSSVGVRIIMEQENQPPLDAESWTFGDEVMVERYIPGRELTVAVLDGEPQAVTEIISHTRFFDYEAKYHDTRTELVLPACIPEDVYQTALRYAKAVYDVVGCNGLARCDFRYNDTGAGPAGLYFLEINTQPGLTPESIGPSQLVYNGLSFPALCAHLVDSAERRFRQNVVSKEQAAPLKQAS
ncbi:MAG: D-alanine--D-alanine ligase [Alphaproteobacteria bacterium]|nr:D-alanine--D-alanine ligase [Alphaproteobacteria bacterium]